MDWTTRLREDERFLRGALYLVLLFGLFVRLYHLTAPVADKHSWKQAAVSTVVRHFVEDGISPLHPQWDMLLGDETGPRYEAEESPVFYVTLAVLSKILRAQEPACRLFSIASSLFAAFILFRLTKRYAGGAAALFAAYFYVLSPFSWYYGRTIQSDSFMIACLILAFERFDLWLSDLRPSYLWQAAIALMLAALMKPYSLHLGAALLVWQVYRRGARSLLDWRLVIFALITIVPPLAWVVYAASLGTLGNAVPKGSAWFAAPHLMGAWSHLWSIKYWNTLQGRIFDQMATPVVALLALAAVLFPEARRRAFPALVFLIGPIVYILIIRSGNKEHNYYQLPFLPPFAMMAGIGLDYISDRKPSWRIALVPFVLLTFTVVSFLYVRSPFRLDMSSQRAGEMVRALSEPGDLILAVDPGIDRNNQVNYAAHRRGWHVGAIHEETVELYRRRGAKWLVLCLDAQREKLHPEYLTRLAGLPLIAHDIGPYGPTGETHRIEVYRLTAPVESPQM